MPISPEKIRRLRLAAGLTQQAAAERAGISRPRWVEIENGRRIERIELPAVESVARALGVIVQQLLR